MRLFRAQSMPLANLNRIGIPSQRGLATTRWTLTPGLTRARYVRTDMRKSICLTITFGTTRTGSPTLAGLVAKVSVGNRVVINTSEATARIEILSLFLAGTVEASSQRDRVVIGTRRKLVRKDFTTRDNIAHNWPASWGEAQVRLGTWDDIMLWYYWVLGC